MRATGRTLVVSLVVCLGLAAGCGKFGPPVRPSPPTYDEGTVYDAGQPVQPGQRERRQ